jgi:hypothetical protein
MTGSFAMSAAAGEPGCRVVRWKSARVRQKNVRNRDFSAQQQMSP